MALNANKTDRFNLNFLTAIKNYHKTTGKCTFLHVQFTNKVLNLSFSKIKDLTINGYVDTNPVRAV
ncbi:hypothetical protein D3C78_1638010 [compost metagenome]